MEPGTNQPELQGEKRYISAVRQDINDIPTAFQRHSSDIPATFHNDIPTTFQRLSGDIPQRYSNDIPAATRTFSVFRNTVGTPEDCTMYEGAVNKRWRSYTGS